MCVHSFYILENVYSLIFLRITSAMLFCLTLQVLCEMFSSVFEDDSLDTPLHPLQATGPAPRIKPLSLLSSLHSSLPRDGARAGCSKVSAQIDSLPHRMPQASELTWCKKRQKCPVSSFLKISKSTSTMPKNP